MHEFSYKVSGTAAKLFPTVSFFSLLELLDGEILEVQRERPFRKGWGIPQSTHLYEKAFHPMPKSLDMVYLSVIEQKFYSLITELPTHRLEELWLQTCPITKKPIYDTLLIGMAPYGDIIIWGYGPMKSSFLVQLHGQEIEVKMSDFMPLKPQAKLKNICASYIAQDPLVKENQEKNGLPPRHLFDNYMKQFTYRYQPMFEQWIEEKYEWKELQDEKALLELDYIEEALFDGTHDKLHDGGLMNYHQAGKPKKLAVKWHIKKSEYTAYFWFEDEEIREVFDRFYGAHPDTKTDFMIRIDSEKNKYELALYRYGLKEPQVISESAYQLLVFKNKFEYYRSENYNQPRGAWIW